MAPTRSVRNHGGQSLSGEVRADSKMRHSRRGRAGYGEPAMKSSSGWKTRVRSGGDEHARAPIHRRLFWIHVPTSDTPSKCRSCFSRPNERAVMRATAATRIAIIAPVGCAAWFARLGWMSAASRCRKAVYIFSTDPLELMARADAGSTDKRKSLQVTPAIQLKWILRTTAEDNANGVRTETWNVRSWNSSRVLNNVDVNLSL